jgi:hypothetical protein
VSHEEAIDYTVGDDAGHQQMVEELRHLAVRRFAQHRYTEQQADRECDQEQQVRWKVRQGISFGL